MVVSSGGSKTPPRPAGGKQGVTSPSTAPTTVNTNSTVVSSSEQAAASVPAMHPPGPQEYEVEYHLHQGEVISLQLGDGRVQIIPGPANIRMVSPNSSPPMALPMQVRPSS